MKIRRAITPVLLSAGLLCLPALASAAPPEDEPELQTPRSDAGEQESATAGPNEGAPDDTHNEGTSDGSAQAETPPDNPDDPDDPDDPDAPATPPDEGTEAGEQQSPEDASSEASPDEEGDGKFGNLLGSEEGRDPQDTSTPRTFSEDGFDGGISEDEKLARYYSALYRPKGNPGRIFFATRALFTNQSANNSAYFGRAGGVQLEVGQTWNKFGYGIAGSVYGGIMQLGSEAEAVGNVMVGGGPSLSLGRLALVRRGFVDLRAGYDFFYVPLTGLVPDAPSALAPHGFRVSLDLGLLLRAGRGKKLRHGVGLSLGYQGFVGSLAGGRLPYTSSLMTGLAYFFG